MEEKRRVYLDYSATTPVKQEVVDEMIPYFTEKFGNASAIYSAGAEAKDALENARARVGIFCVVFHDFSVSGSTFSLPSNCLHTTSYISWSQSMFLVPSSNGL